MAPTEAAANAGDDAILDDPDAVGSATRYDPARRGRGRRDADGWVISPKMLGAVATIITIVCALFSPVFYVRDMSTNVLNISRAVEEMRRAQDNDRQKQAEDHAALIVLQAQAAQGAAQRADHEQRIRVLEAGR